MECVEFERTPAMEWLEEVRYHAGRIEPLTREIAGIRQAYQDVLPWVTSGSGSGGGTSTHSDPTATHAHARIDGLERLLADRQARLDESTGIVGTCLRLIAEMGAELGERHADVIETYYVDCAPTWSAVAWEVNVSRMEVWRLRRDAYEWFARHMP